MGGFYSVSVASPRAEGSAAHHGVTLDAQLMEVLLQTLTRAPAAWRAAEFVGCHEPSAALRSVLQPDDAAMRAEQLRPFALSDELEAELQGALHVAASRGAAAKLAAMLACTGSLGRAVADTFAPAEERAARVAQALHDMVHALRESGDLPAASLPPPRPSPPAPRAFQGAGSLRRDGQLCAQRRRKRGQPPQQCSKAAQLGPDATH